MNADQIQRMTLPEIEQVIHKMELLQVIAEEAMRIMTDKQLVELRHRLGAADTVNGYSLEVVKDGTLHYGNGSAGPVRGGGG